MDLADLGFTSSFAGSFSAWRETGHVPARVSREDRGRYVVWAEGEELTAELAGRFRHEIGSRSELPAVGDFVALRARPGEGKGVIAAVLSRRSAFSRRAAGTGTHPEEQVVAANVDVVFLVMGLDLNYNLRRLERYVTLAWESGAMPAVVLNKADLLAPDGVRRCVGDVEACARGIPVHSVSAKEGTGLEALRARLGRGTTGAFLGSSGVGKSSLVNALAGAPLLPVGEARAEDGRGRHTTSRRELIALPSGGLVVDTPGMRELQLWAGEASLDTAFADISSASAQCRFRDCRHEGEPGCAVRRALEEGALDPARFESYRKERKEIDFLERRADPLLAAAHRARWKAILKSARRREKG